MIKWIKPTTEESFPKSGDRILFKLSDGRIIAATVNKDLGIEMDMVDNIDLAAAALSQNFEFHKLD